MEKEARKNRKKKSDFLILLCLILVFGIMLGLNFTSHEMMKLRGVDNVHVFHQLTNQLINEALIIDHGDEVSKEMTEQSIRETIAMRKEYAMELIKTNPALFLKSAINNELKGDLALDYEGIENMQEFGNFVVFKVK